MKRFLFLSLLALNMSGIGIVHAEKADVDAPISIEADQMVYNHAKQSQTATGNVVFTRGTLVIKAGKIVITQDPKGYQAAVVYATPGAVATFRQKLDGGPNLWVEGEAERIEYNGKDEVVKFFSNAKLRRLDGQSLLDEVQGNFISYDVRSEFFTVNNAEPGKSGGRVKAVIQPRKEAKGQ